MLSDICDTQFAPDRINGLSGVYKICFRASQFTQINYKVFQWQHLWVKTNLRVGLKQQNLSSLLQ